MKLNNNGYYLSSPIHYEDWQAGIKITRLNYLAFYFDGEGTVYRKGKKDITIFSKDDFIKFGAKGEYSIKGNTIEYIFKKGQEFEICRNLNIHGIDLLSDQDQDEYSWTSFPKENKTEESTIPKTET